MGQSTSKPIRNKSCPTCFGFRDIGEDCTKTKDGMHHWNMRYGKDTEYVCLACGKKASEVVTPCPTCKPEKTPHESRS